MSDSNTDIKQLNTSIINAHNAHYAISSTGLVHPTKQPNENIVYHLYSTGEISFQKGGYAYMARSEFMTEGKLSNYQKLSLVFPNQAVDGTTYVILTKEECKNFRFQMIELIQKLI